MSAIEAVDAYFNAWNARDAAAILASLGEDGTYQDPTTEGPISGAALKGYIEALWAGFPDLAFEKKSRAETGGGRVAAEWIMRGTNSGSFRGLPPTGKSIECTGADFFETANGKVTSVVGYFDPVAFPRQLGLQVIVQPEQVGPFRFGTSVAVQSGSTQAPGAFSVTQIEALDEDKAVEVREASRQIMVEMLKAPGFIGATVGKIGPRQYTLSAWTDSEAPAEFMRQGGHAEAMKTFFAGTLARSAYTSVWSPERINPYWVRCESCGTMHDADKSGPTCGCGAQVPDHPPYW